jgi:hypothetical protein
VRFHVDRQCRGYMAKTNFPHWTGTGASGYPNLKAARLRSLRRPARSRWAGGAEITAGSRAKNS